MAKLTQQFSKAITINSLNSVLLENIQILAIHPQLNSFIYNAKLIFRNCTCLKKYVTLYFDYFRKVNTKLITYENHKIASIAEKKN